ncbi:MAG: hypothetical protein AAF226_15465 [Verrucomicrobiota bacterium]
MRSAFLFALLLGLLSSTHAQSFSDETRRRMTERNTGGTNMVRPNTTAQKVQISYVTFLTKEREWIDAKGRKMLGRLEAISAPAPDQPGPVIVIAKDQVKLRRAGAKAASVIPLASLSVKDQNYIRQIHRAANPPAKNESAEPAEAPVKPE